VFTYPAGIGLDTLNFVSTVGAVVLAVGFAIVLWDVVQTVRKGPMSERNPWRGGTLEWLQEIPSLPWGVRSIPEIDSRYPLWDQPNFMRDVDEGRFFLPDAEEGERETLVTSVIDAKPVQCLRVPGPTSLTIVAALFTGGVFIFSTYAWWWLALGSGVLAVVAILAWLWTGTAMIPEKAEKNVGLGVTLPLYASGQASVGWWAMLITMLGDATAFMSLIFGYFFYWTVRADFPPESMAGPGVFWPALGGALLVAAWGLTILARRWNRSDRGALFHAAVLAGVAANAAGCAALLAGPWLTGLDPEAHVYAAIVWVLVIWTAAHGLGGLIMQLYCSARRLFGRMDARHDIDIANTTLYWHFVAATAVVTVAVIAGFPLVS
jgi:cytochrome c oxidase subunit I+III